MGMRAGIIYKDKTGTSVLTTLQWSTRLDQTLGHHIARSGNPMADVKHIFKSVVDKYSHVSAMEIVTTPEGRLSGAIKACNGYEWDGHSERARSIFDGHKEAMECHLDSGSIGAMFDESHPDRITFYFISDKTDEIEVKNCSIEALGKFYKDVEGKPGKLKKFSFRSN